MLEEPNLIRAGVGLMLSGMATVFAFLVLLVAATRGLGWLASILTSDQSPIETSADDAEQIAAVTAAVAHHRALHGSISG